MRDRFKNARTVTVMSTGHMTTHWYTGLLMILVPYLQKTFSLSFAEVGLLISLRSLAGATGNITSGFIADFLGRRSSILVFSLAGIALCWLMVSLSHSFFALIVFLTTAWMFSNLWHAPSMSILSEAYPEKKGFVFGIHGAAAHVGQSLSPLIAGFLISYAGWRFAVRVSLAPAVLTALLVVLVLPSLQIANYGKKKGSDFLGLVKNHLLKNRALLAVCVVTGLRTMAQRGLETFLALFLARKMGLGPTWVGFYLMVLLIASTFPEPFMGWLSDYFGRKWLLFVCFTVSGLAVIGITLAKPGLPALAGLALLGLFLYSIRPILFALAMDITPPEIGASTISYVFTWSQTFSAIAPIVGGFLADAFGITFALYFIAFLLLTATVLVTVLMKVYYYPECAKL